MNYLELKTTNF